MDNMLINYMKRLVYFTICAAITLIAGCERYDDSKVWEEIDSVKSRVSALETVTDAYKNNLFISSVQTLTDGYLITFSDGSQAAVVNGKDGENGKDGKDGKDGDTCIAGIEIGEEEVKFELSSGERFSIPHYLALSVTFDVEDFAAILPESTREIGYTIESNLVDDIKVEVLSSADLKAMVRSSEESSLTGKIVVRTGASVDEYSRIVVLVSNGQKVIMRSLNFDEGVLSGVEDAYVAEWESGLVQVVLRTNLDYTVEIPSDAQEWLSMVSTRATMRSDTLTFSLTENPHESPRSASVKLIGEDGDLLQSFTVLQKLQPSDDNIVFADEIVKKVCVKRYDTDGDGELSYKEASEVTSITKDFFRLSGDQDYRNDVKSFDELRHFINVTEIEDGAFNMCRNLTSVTLPEGLASIGVYAFAQCTSLSGITIPKSVTRIDQCAFQYCSSLTEIILPEGITEIAAGTFNYCSSLSDIVLPESVTKLGLSSISFCKSLKSIILPENLTEIGDHAFNYCPKLTSINFPKSLTTIGKGAFHTCMSLTGIRIPDGVTSIGPEAFINCESLRTITIPEGVNEIADELFINCTGLTSVTIPDGVTRIGDEAFYCCSSLADITIPATVTDIGVKVFLGCRLLSTFSGKFSSADGRCLIDDGHLIAFAPAGLTEYAIPNEVTSIGASVFESCSSLESVTIPNEVTSIGASVFESCSALESVTIPEGVVEIGDRCFSGCKAMTSCTLPKSLTTIGERAFRYCDNLVELTIQEGITEIEDDAFYGCQSLESIHITDYEAWNAISFGNYAANPLCNRGARLYLNGEDITDTAPLNYRFMGDWYTTGGTWQLSTEGITSVTTEKSKFNITSYDEKRKEFTAQGLVDSNYINARIGFDPETETFSLEKTYLVGINDRYVCQMLGTYDEEKVFVPYEEKVFGTYDRATESLKWNVPENVEGQLYFAIVYVNSENEYDEPVNGFWKIEDFGFTRK